MNDKLRKIVALVSAISMLSVSTISNVFAVDTTDDGELEYTEFPFIRECEDPEIANGNETWTDIYGQTFDGYSGDGFIYLTGNSLKFEVTVPEDDMYEIKVRYTQILSEDGRMQTISVNDTDYMVNFPYTDTWQDISFGMFRLKAGVNTIEIKPQYGYASYDTITVEKADFPALDVEPTLADKDATSETQSLMNYLCDVYGNGILSGQQEIYGGGNDGDYELEFDYIESLTGELPAIRGFDFMNYNPLYGWDDNTTERIIEWVTERNGIATACWHINVPKDFTSYELGEAVGWEDCTYKPDETDFDTNNAIVEGTKEYEYFMLAVEDLAEQLQRLQDANVPIILRPLHEAEGNTNTDGSGSWFWWGKGGAETYKELWKLLFTTLTEEYGLHNIIWEYNSYDYTTSAQWYPGDEYVDMVGYDKYNTVYNRHDGLTSGPNVDAISSTFYSLVNLTNGKKLVSMPENDTIPTVENMEVEQARWLYFCPWYGEHILDSSKNDPETVKAIYQDDYCINLADLPEDLYDNQSQGDVTIEPTPITPTETTTEYAHVYGLDGNTLKIIYDTLSGSDIYEYELSDEEVAKFPTDIDELINTNLIVTLKLIDGTDQYDMENPLYIDIQLIKYGTITAKDDDTITITLDGGEGDMVVPSSYNSTSDYPVGENLIIAINERTNELLWIDGLGTNPDYTTTTNEFDIPVVLTGTVTEVDTENDTITVDFTECTQTIKGYSANAKVGDIVTASNMSDVIDDEWFETATIEITPSTSTSATTTPQTTKATTTTSDSDDSSTTTGNGETLLGDANCDGTVKNNDVQTIRQMLLHEIDEFEEGSQEFINSDVNEDGYIKNNDVQMIRQYILHIIDSL